MTDLTNLSAEVDAAVAAEGNAVAYIQKLVGELAAASGDQAAVDALAAKLKAATDALAAAAPAPTPTAQ